MSDCRNGEMRDRLPEVVHGRLADDALAEIRAHVAGCDACAAELRLIESTRAMLLLATPRVDTARIVAAVPAFGARAPRRLDWRYAAAAALVLAAGGLFAIGRGSAVPKT